jgi:glucokinase
MAAIGENIAVGIDIGGTSTKIGLVGKDGNILKSVVLPTVGHKEVSTLISEISRTLEETIPGGFANSAIRAVGVGAPNANFFRGTIAYAPNLEFARDREVKFSQIFKRITNHRPMITNDANAAAIGEKLFGHARDMSDFMVVTLGTGLGCGIYTSGQILYGSDGLAGEMGHTVLVRNGRKCKCGKRGCIETYVSAAGITKTYNELITSAPPVDNPTQIFKLAADGQSDAIIAFHITGEYLGSHLADMATLFSPECIFLSGGIANAGEFLLGPAYRAFEENLMLHHKGKIKIKMSKLKDQQTAILGAAALGWQSLKKLAKS